jgi:hypothetical protein
MQGEEKQGAVGVERGGLGVGLFSETCQGDRGSPLHRMQPPMYAPLFGVRCGGV